MAKSATGMVIATPFVAIACNALLIYNSVLMQEPTLVRFTRIVLHPRTVTLHAAHHFLLRAMAWSIAIKVHKES